MSNLTPEEQAVFQKFLARACARSSSIERAEDRDVLALIRRLDARVGDAARLADEVSVLVRRGVLDSRSPTADALLDFREPPSTPRADRLALLEGERDALAQRVEELEKVNGLQRAALDVWKQGKATKPA